MHQQFSDSASEAMNGGIITAICPLQLDNFFSCFTPKPDFILIEIHADVWPSKL